jgi:hypothetical protein
MWGEVFLVMALALSSGAYPLCVVALVGLA